MIRHIVFFTANDSADLAAIETGLHLLADIPYHRHFQVSRNLGQDTLSGAVDLVVYAEFDDASALADYKLHPLYEQAIRIVRPLRDLRIAADIEG